MASNKHYEIELTSLVVRETEAPSFGELLRLADLPNTPNPFGNVLKRGKFVVDKGKKWLLDDRIVGFNFQEGGYHNEVAQFRLELSFDTAIEVSEIDETRFLYSISRNISQSGWRKHSKGGGTFFQLDTVDEGSIRVNFYAGIVAVGAFVANYPDLKQGFLEILTDTRFIAEQIVTATRAAKLPEPARRERDHEAPRVLVQEAPPRRRSPSTKLLLRDH